jgi:hypothetical protein
MFKFFSRSEKPTCLEEIYRKLEKKFENIYGEVHGGYVRNVRVVVEEIEELMRADTSFGIKWAWVRCGDVCKAKGYVRFRSGGVKTGNASESKLGDMEPGKSYNVEGSTMLDHHGTLVISNLQ